MENLYIEILKVSSDGNEVTIGDLQGNENYKINKIQKIDLDNPSCEYEKRVADAYSDIVESEINKEKEKINENKTNIAA